MKKHYNLSQFLRSALGLIAILMVSGSIWGQVTWTGGDLPSREINKANSRNYTDLASFHDGVYVADDVNYTIGLQQSSRNKENRIGFRKFTGSFSVTPYTKTTYIYTADVHAYCMESSTWNTNYPYIATEFFSFGTTFPTNFNLNTNNNSDLSTSNYSIVKAKIAGPPKESEKDRTQTKDFNLEGDNSTGASTKDVTLWFGLFAYSRPADLATSTASTKNRGGANFTYKSVEYTYYTTVTFNANGGSGSMTAQEITATSTTATTPLSANAYTRSGYAFAGWNTAADGSGTMYADKADFLAYNSSTNGGRGPVTLYAIWIPYYNISFDANGGTGTMSNMSYIAMDKVFDIPANGFTAPTYTISFDSNGGEEQSPIAKTLDFNGWEDHGDIVGSDGNSYTYLAYDAAYYANKNPDVLFSTFANKMYDKLGILTHYIVHGEGEGRKPLNPDGVRGTYLAGEKTSGGDTATISQLTRLTTTPGYTVPLYAQWVGSITLPTLTRTGYTFDGWYDGTEKVGDGGDTYNPVADITLVAHWTADYVYVTTNYEGWASFSHEWNLVSEDADLTIYKGSLAGEVLSLTEVNYIAANEGVVLKGDPSTTYALVALTPTTEEFDDNDLLASVTSTPRNQSVTTYCLSSKNSTVTTAFYEYVGANIPANKAYLEVGGYAAPARIRVRIAGVTTDLEETEEAVLCEKVMIDGQIFIRKADRLYNLQGQLVK